MTILWSRRTLLRAAGCAVTLPLLHSLMPRSAWAQSAVTPKRLVALYFPNGMLMDAWTPTTTGSSYALTPLLQPLAPFKAKLNVLSGLSNLAADEANFDTGHHSPTASFLTSTTPHEGPNANGQSVDQMAAAVLGTGTRLRSLVVGTPDDGWNMWMKNISWDAMNTPVPKQVSPAKVFDQLFAGTSPTQTELEAQKRRAYRRSVLDAVVGEVSRLKPTLAAADGARLDQYLTSVRELEQRIDQAQPACTPGTRPSTEMTLPECTRAMMDLIALALQCDATRVATYMHDRAGSDIPYPSLGVHQSHHVLSHELGNASAAAAVQKINLWEMEQLAYLLQKLDAVPDGDGTLLDQCAVLCSSDLSDGGRHNKDDLPVVVAGRAGGALVTGAHRRYASQTPRANLFLTLLQAVGAPRNAIGDSTGLLTDLLA